MSATSAQLAHPDRRTPPRRTFTADSPLSWRTARVMRLALRRAAPPERIGILEWAERERVLAPGTTALPGPYRAEITPWVPHILAAMTRPGVRKVLCQKSAQVAWTDGVLNNFVGWMIDTNPGPMLLVFPKEDAAKKYARKKLEPMIRATDTLAARVDLTSRKGASSTLLRIFPGGWLQLAGGNSPSNLKSDPCKFVAVEEPDDLPHDVRGQGGAIEIAEARKKTFPDHLVLIGGTPTIKGMSTIEDEMKPSTRTRFWVPCHECGDSHVLAWDNVSWQRDPNRRHPVFGDSLPETAVYVCPHCGSPWTDAQKVANCQHMEPRDEQPGANVVGFYLNELMAGWEDSRLARLVERYLTAQHEVDQGRPGALIEFYNQTLGEAYEVIGDAPEEAELQSLVESYAPWSTGAGGLVVTGFADVQHDRLHVNVYAWGRNLERWLVAREVLVGNTIDKTDPVWCELDALLARPVAHPTGATLRIRAFGIDAGDGQTSDAVYTWVRQHQRRLVAGADHWRHMPGIKVIATKGSSVEKSEVFQPLRQSVDVNRTGKAAKYGLRVHMIGVSKAKDQVVASLKLTAQQRDGAARFHFHRDTPADFFEQLTSEVKVPVGPRRTEWQVRRGRRNEDLDCTVGCLHGAYMLRLHQMTDGQWRALEKQMAQPDLLAPVEEGTEDEAMEEGTPAAEPEVMPPPAPRPPRRPPRRGGSWVTGWRG